MQIELLVACFQEGPTVGWCTQLTRASGGRIAAKTVSTEAVLRTTLMTRPDVLLLEHTAGEEHKSRRLLSDLDALRGRTRVLLLCDAYPQVTLVSFIRRGVHGCLLRSSDPSLGAKAVITVHQGETWFGRNELLQALRSQVVRGAPVPPELLVDQQLLTAREREILLLVGGALSNKEIARKLRISDKTVKTHLHHIYVKLHRSGRFKAFLSDAAGAPAYRAMAGDFGGS